MILKSVLPVRSITDKSFAELTGAAKLIVADSHGPKVMQLDNGNIIKLFRRKRVISSAMFAPYAVRFGNNALRLKELGIPTITPVSLLYCKQQAMHIVEYEPLRGDLLRGLLQQDGNKALFELTASFIAKLHHKGIYFRSLHFENIIHHNGQLGLIDVADMKIYRKPLGKALRQRNFRHFMRYPADAQLIKGYGVQQFEDIYLRSLSSLRNNQS